jgi:hypothetical protein
MYKEVIRVYSDASFGKFHKSCGVGVKIMMPNNNVCYDSFTYVGVSDSYLAEYIGMYEAVALTLDHVKEEAHHYILKMFTDNDLVRDIIQSGDVRYYKNGVHDIRRLLRHFGGHAICRRTKAATSHMFECDSLAKKAMHEDDNINESYCKVNLRKQ